MGAVARRVQPQKRGPGGKFAKATPPTEPSTAPGTDPGPPVISYDDPPKPARSTARRSTARAGKKRTPSTAPSTEPSTVEPPAAPPRQPSATPGRPLGFLDGLLGPFGLRGAGG